MSMGFIRRISTRTSIIIIVMLNLVVFIQIKAVKVWDGSFYLCC